MEPEWGEDKVSDGQDRRPPVSTGSGVPMWIWGAALLALGLIGWGFLDHSSPTESYLDDTPFFQVTNREFSLFLWQNPEFMRRHAQVKDGYLPGFARSGRRGMIAADAEERVVAPPDILFRYHIWKRLLGSVRFSRKIDPKLFQKFLKDEPAWLPENWPEAPKAYAQMVRLVDTYADLNEADQEELPWQVRQAYIGWLNYFEEGEAVNDQQVTVGELRTFLDGHSGYARHYWRNIVLDSVPEYVKIAADSKVQNSAEVPMAQLTPFLRVALYNNKMNNQ